MTRRQTSAVVRNLFDKALTTKHAYCNPKKKALKYCNIVFCCGSQYVTTGHDPQTIHIHLLQLMCFQGLVLVRLLLLLSESIFCCDEYNLDKTLHGCGPFELLSQPHCNRAIQHSMIFERLKTEL